MLKATTTREGSIIHAMMEKKRQKKLFEDNYLDPDDSKDSEEEKLELFYDNVPHEFVNLESENYSKLP